MTPDAVFRLIERNGLAVVFAAGLLWWGRQFVTKALENARTDQQRMWDEMKGSQAAMLQIVRDSTTATISASEAIRTNTEALRSLSIAVERLSRPGV